VVNQSLSRPRRQARTVRRKELPKQFDARPQNAAKQNEAARTLISQRYAEMLLAGLLAVDLAPD
jgi:hypothetical protein